jgi:imidazolonepropionase-like amidohydrolase
MLRTCLPLVIGLLAGTQAAAGSSLPVRPGDPAGAATQDGGVTQDAEAAPAPETAILVRAGRLILRPGRELQDTAVLIQGGRIAAIGADLPVPEGAQVLEGAVVCPGFIDGWSTLGVDGQSLADRSASPATRTVDGFDPYSEEHWRRSALAAGVVAARIQAGAAARIGGVGAVVQVAAATERADWLVLEDACVGAVVQGGDVFERVDGVDRLVTAIEKGASYRQSQLDFRTALAEWEQKIAEAEKKLTDDFKKAKKDREKKQADAKKDDKEFKDEKYKEDKRPSEPRYDPDDEVLARVATGELPIVIEAHRAGDIRRLLDRMAALPRVRWVLAGATDAHFFAERLGELRVPVLLVPQQRGLGGSFEADEFQLAGRLQAEGVQVLFGSGGASAVRDLPLMAALAVGHGLDPEAALAAITTVPAQVFDVADRLGSIEVGRPAHLLVLSGDPLSSASRVQYVLLNGEVAHGELPR